MKIQNTLLGGAALLALSSSWAQAQSLPQDNAPEMTEEDVITVSGVRLANENAIAEKRAKIQIADTISSDDIGRAPDFNVSDSLQRISGVLTIPEEDEGQFVAVRGINADLTMVTFDGATVASASEGENRRISLEFFPSAVVSGLEVIKSRTPDIDGNTIGGLVNIKTLSAFDKRGLYAVGNAMIGFSDATKVPVSINDGDGKNGMNYRVSGTIATTFGSNDDFGLVLAGSILRRDRDEQRIIPINFQSNGDFTNPSSSYAPGLTIYSSYNNPINRYGGLGKLEYKPSNTFYMSLEGAYFFQKDYARRESELIIGGTADFASQFSGNIIGANLALNHDQFEAENIFATSKFRAEYDGDDGWQAAFMASYSYGEFAQTSPAINFGGPSINAGYAYDDNGAPIITPADPAVLANPANYPLLRAKPFATDYDNKVTEFKADIGKNYNDIGLGFKVGSAYRKTTQDNEFGNATYTPTTGTNLTLADFAANTNYNSPWRPSAPLSFVNGQAVMEYIRNNPNEFTKSESPNAELYRIAEDVLAGYAALSYGGDNFQIIAGGRFESTTVTSNAGANTQKHSYQNFLPSALVNFDVSDNVKLRASYARALGRANPGQLKLYPNIDPAAVVPSISGGNPRLKPRLADNFDLSVEYYFDRGQSFASIAVFHKAIKDEILSLSEEINFNGVNVKRTTPENAESAKISGIEFGLTKNSFDFLPGFLADFGASVNFTYLDASTKLRDTVDSHGVNVNFVFEQPKYLFNAALFYQSGPVEAQLSYVKSGAYHAGFAGDPGFLDVMAKSQKLDFQIRLDINDNFSVLGEARNITDEPLARRTGPGQNLLNDQSNFGRSFFIGATVKY